MFGFAVNLTKKELEQALARAEKSLKENPNSDVHKMLVRTIKKQIKAAQSTN